MFKRYQSVLLFLCFICATSCSARSGAGVLIEPMNIEQSDNVLNTTYDEKPDGTLIWNGFELIREDYTGRANDVFVPENVLTTEDRILTVFFASSSGNDIMEYGVTEVIQVNLDGTWYTLPFNMSRSDEPLLLVPLSADVTYLSEEGKTRHTVDLSVAGKLPPGQYRLVERFFWKRLQIEYYAIAYFWVIEPGGERPPESETNGPARIEDISISVMAVSGAQRVITDKDDILTILIENLSGKEYEAVSATLEIKSGSQWHDVEYQHANLGLMFGWERNENMLFLNNPLPAGDYRLRLRMRVFNTQGEIEPEYKFSVIAYENAPEPKWEVSQLSLSRHNAVTQSTDVKISISNPVLDNDNMELEFMITVTDGSYSYGDPYIIEVLLDGIWYSVPYAYGGAFNSPAYSVDPNTDQKQRTHSINPTFEYGTIPVGQYRLIKEFNLVGPDSPEGMPTYLTKEFVFALFTVTETLDRTKLIN